MTRNGGFCVSIVSIVCTTDAYSLTPARSARDPVRAALTMLTVLTVFSVLVLTLIILVPVRPSRENVISIPSVRRNVCARRLGFFGPALPLNFQTHVAFQRRDIVEMVQARRLLTRQHHRNQL